MELAWHKEWYYDGFCQPSNRFNLVLCQKVESAGKDFWVKIPTVE